MQSGKTIVVTGATRGLGRALVEGFVAGGHTVLGCGRSEAGVAALSVAYAEPNAFARVDVSDDDAVADWAGTCLAARGAPDLVINNAGWIHRNAALWKIPDAEIAQVLDTNVRGTASVVRHFLPAMIAAGRGVVANMSSTWGRTAAPEVAGYCASKWAIEGLTGSLAQELPRGLAAVAVNPGVIDTDMLRSTFGSSAAGFAKPLEWAETAVPFFLALSSADNGASLTVG